jgi:hypothetical protein
LLEKICKSVSKCRKKCGEIYFETEDGALTVFKDFKKKAKKWKEIYLKLGMKVVLKKLRDSGFMQIDNRHYCFNTT